MKRALLFISCLLLVSSTLATTVRPVTLSEMYDRSKFVIFGRIESGRILPDDCGTEYAVRVEKGFKGAAPGTVLAFRGDTIQVGANYYLFLSPHESQFTPLMSTNSGHMSLRAKFEARCKGKLPPLDVNVFGVGAMKSTGTYSSRVKRAVIVDGFMIDEPKELPVTLLQRDDRYDNDHSNTAFEASQFDAYMLKLSQGKK